MNIEIMGEEIDPSIIKNPVRLMPNDFDSEPTEFAGMERTYETNKVMMLEDGTRVVILNYDIDKGLYVVMNLDKEGTVTPIYKINPNKLLEIK